MALFVRRRWPKVLAAVAVLAAIALAVVLVTRDTGSDPAAPLTEPDVETAEPVPEPSPDVVAFEAVLAAPDGGYDRYEGYQVTATSQVLAVVGPSAMWVGEPRGERVLLVLVGGTEPFTFKVGTRVSFTGTVHQAAPGFGRALGLSARESAAFDRQGGYVEVGTVTAA